MKLYLVLASLIALAVSRTLIFKVDDCNTNFANDANWDAGAPALTDEELEQGAKPFRTVFFGEAEDFEPVSSFASAETPFRATELAFAEDGILELEGDGTTIEFWPSDLTEGQTHFIAGQGYTQKCDFACHKNYMDSLGNDVEDPPNSLDTVVILPGYSTKIQILGAVNEAYAIKPGNADLIQDKFELPQYQFHPGPQKMNLDFDNQEGLCEALGFHQDGACFSWSTCDEENHLLTSKQLANLAKEKATIDLNSLKAIRRRPYSLTFRCHALLNFLDTNMVNQIFGAMEMTYPPSNNNGLEIPNTELVDEISRRVGETLANVATSVDVFKYDSSNGRLTIGGFVQAPALFFLRPGPDGTMEEVWVESGIISSVSPNNIFFLKLFESLRNIAMEVYSEKVGNDVDMKLQACDKYGMACSIFEQLRGMSAPSTFWDNMDVLGEKLEESRPEVPATMPPTPEPTEANDPTTEEATEEPTNEPRRRRDQPTNEPTDEPTDEPTTTTSTTTSTSTSTTTPVWIDLPGDITLSEDELQFDEGADDEQIQDFFNAFKQLLGQVPRYEPNREAMMDAVEQYFDMIMHYEYYLEETSGVEDVQPVPHDMPAAVLGSNNPQNRLNRILDWRNEDEFPNHVQNVIGNLYPFSDIDPESFEMEFVHSNDLEDDDEDQQLKRRDDTPPATQSGLAQTLLMIKFRYLMYTSDDCVEGSQSFSCPVSDGGVIFEFLEELLQDVLSVYEIEEAPCNSLDSGVDRECVKDKTDEAIRECAANNPDYTREWLINSCGVLAYFTQWDCGDYGMKPDGTCHSIDAENAANAAAAEDVPPMVDAIIAELTATTTTIASNDGGTSASIVPIAGGAAGAVVVIIIIVLVVIFVGRGGDREPKEKSSATDRTVVAFENPMYDDPGQSPEAMYDEAHGVGIGDDEGLYDEPAFNASKKTNPMYSSQEYLDAEGADDDNYLDNNPDGEEEEVGGGYLDVAPDDDIDDDE